MSRIILYNTLSRRKEEFKPLKKGQVLIYHCGPTVYWTQHIGNLRGMAVADFIRRSFLYLGYNVKYVRNYTDVGHLTGDNEGDADTGEDRMEKAARREKLNPQAIADKYIKIFEKDVKALNLLEPDAKPRATGYIEEMIKMVGELIDKGFAYTTDLAVYFDISKAKDYTALSRQNIDEQIAGAGSGDVSDPEKKHRCDFALWFFRAGEHKNALQYWPSPFSSKLVEKGNGFPGWHLECSAMCRELLGKTIDIHMGGIEHVPIHHTNEIAQSEAANDAKFVNYWLHNEHLLVDNGKMSKSLGTVYSIDEIINKGFSPLALRYFFLQAHYRSKQNFTWEALEAAQNGYEHLKNQVRELPIADCRLPITNKYKEKFVEAISDDFNTPQAMAVVQELLKSDLSDEEKLTTVLDFDKVLGLDLHLAGDEPELPEKVRELLAARDKARDGKDFDKADKIRQEIDDLGYTIEDTSGGVRVCKK